MGNARWRRLTEERAGSAKSVFHFDVQGSVAKSTHAGIPWLRFIRQRLGAARTFLAVRRLGHSGRALGRRRGLSGAVEPQLRPRGRTGDQHDAYSIAAWLSRADRDGSLAASSSPT